MEREEGEGGGAWVPLALLSYQGAGVGLGVDRTAADINRCLLAG